MVDKIEKVLRKLSQREREKIKIIISEIKRSNFNNLDLKKMKGRDDIFRIRKGDIRIIFRKINNSIKILTVERRVSKTYKRY